MKQIALIKTGSTLEQIRRRHGDFENWFEQGLGFSDFLQIDVYRNQPLPPTEKLKGVVITGSTAMVSDREDWSERTAEWLADIVRNGKHVLGVCYGHQLLAHALGGKAGPNPTGRQIGTVKSQLVDSYESDPLLGHLPETFLSQTSHSEAVLELPPGARRLATSPKDTNFAIRFAKNVWGVQFHPEFSKQITSEYIQYRADDIRKEGLQPEKLMKNSKETNEAASVLKVFAEMLRIVS